VSGEDGTITAIRPLPADPNQRCVLVEDREVARLAAADVEALALREGDAWTAEVRERVRELEAIDVVRRDALKALGRRAFSRRELCERLARAHDAALCEAVVDECCEHGWLDDDAYARDLAESVLRRGPAGAALLVGRLEQRGIDTDRAERIVGEVLADRDEVEAAVALAEGRLDRPATEQSLRRVAALLARRGFDENTVRLAIHRLERPQPDQ
jgi:regulatory protein